jgi:hypothetical protein
MMILPRQARDTHRKNSEKCCVLAERAREHARNGVPQVSFVATTSSRLKKRPLIFDRVC